MTLPTGRPLAVLQHERETGLGVFGRLLQETGVAYELIETTPRLRLPDVADFDGAIVLGGSRAANDPALYKTRRWLREAAVRDIPLLGICLGGQLLAAALGGRVGRASPPEAGIHDVFLTSAARSDPVFGTLPARFSVFGWHEDAFELPCGAVPLAGSIACEHQAFRFKSNVYALQFHSEIRPDDLHGWADVPGYAALLEHTRGRWDDIAAELEHAAPELDALAHVLLERWLDRVSDAAELRRQQTPVAV
jgi:GMP synthase-like glutamine amidotransferase